MRVKSTYKNMCFCVLSVLNAIHAKRIASIVSKPDYHSTGVCSKNEAREQSSYLSLPADSGNRSWKSSQQCSKSEGFLLTEKNHVRSSTVETRQVSICSNRGGFISSVFPKTVFDDATIDNSYSQRDPIIVAADQSFGYEVQRQKTYLNLKMAFFFFKMFYRCIRTTYLNLFC